MGELDPHPSNSKQSRESRTKRMNRLLLSIVNVWILIVQSSVVIRRGAPICIFNSRRSIWYTRTMQSVRWSTHKTSVSQQPLCFLFRSESKKYYITAIFITIFLTRRASLSIETVKGDNRVFYMRPDTIFLEDPRLQNAFRNDFLKQISTPPQPEPFTILADSIQKSMTEDVSDQSMPQDIRHMMVKFYKRRQYKL